MRKAKCLDCGAPGERLHCNSCNNIISVCETHRNDFFPVDTPSKFACVDCTNSGMSGIQRQIEKRGFGRAR